ncbi:hypothetical protein CEXT_473481 [Caerostris extrusa]|uniref:Uncharacterized protein n=1 Tax=Caerostris extrusa TaxID=172846 RepID=A0AAV4V4X2_CAEEX|nr:hypothetical protein CEXT_473481 [Caerostris extrusa]
MCHQVKKRKTPPPHRLEAGRTGAFFATAHSPLKAGRVKRLKLSKIPTRNLLASLRDERRDPIKTLIPYLKQNVPPGEKKGELPHLLTVCVCDCPLTIKRPSLRRFPFCTLNKRHAHQDRQKKIQKGPRLKDSLLMVSEQSQKALALPASRRRGGSSPFFPLVAHSNLNNESGSQLDLSVHPRATPIDFSHLTRGTHIKRDKKIQQGPRLKDGLLMVSEQSQKRLLFLSPDDEEGVVVPFSPGGFK